VRVVTVSRKPVASGTTTQNVLEHEAGALNIDPCRIRTEGETFAVPQSDPGKRKGTVGTDLGITRKDVDGFQAAQRESIERTQLLGRWPANVILMGAAPPGSMDEQSGTSVSGARGGPVIGGPPRSNHGFKLSETSRDRTEAVMSYGDDGGASRYFKRVP
jgi:hypothetical protein